jgi:hypothetical protein
MVEQRSKYRQEDNIEMDLRKIWCEDVKKSELAQDRQSSTLGFCKQDD